MAVFKSISRLKLNFNKIIIKSIESNAKRLLPALQSDCLVNTFYTSCPRKDLMEFFDDKENWGEREVRVGRSWKIEELRIKSNSDLHKLWYVLLKERNMLLTMEHEFKNNKEHISMPNPERIDKVEESMENLEAVVRERNQAYFQLETGLNGERPSALTKNCFGLEYKYRMSEHVIQKKYNKEYKKKVKLMNETNDHMYVNDFLAKLEEKKKNLDFASLRLKYKEVCGLLERFPNMDEEALKAKYPDVDIEQAKKDRLSRGHRENLN